MFEVGNFHESASCLLCKKDKPCVQARCKSGTLSGLLCAKCLFTQIEARTACAKDEEPQLFDRRA